MRCFDSVLFKSTISSCLMVLLFASLCMGNDFNRILLLETMDVKVVTDRSHWLLLQLKELGYREGINMKLTVLKAKGNYQLAESLLKEYLEKNNPDLVISNATLASKAASRILKDTAIPQLFVTVSDPVGAGLVDKIGVSSGKNITGRVHNITREIKINIVLRLIGDKIKTRPIRFGYLYSSYASSVNDLRQLKAIAAKNNNITYIPYKIQYREFPDNVDQMLKDLSIGLKELEGKIDFLWAPFGPFAESAGYNKLVQTQTSVPMIFGVNEKSVQSGALLFMAPDSEAEGREVGILADRILKGEQAGRIPVIPPLKFKMGINFTTAQKMDIVVPPDLMELIGKNIYR